MNYVDLNLPSSTLWAETNEDGYYTFEEAVDKFGDSLPTKEEFEELIKYTASKWIENDHRKFTSSNGNSILFPANSFCNLYGNYWSSSFSYPYNSWYFYFTSDSQQMRDNGDHWYGFYVRLVKRKTEIKTDTNIKTHNMASYIPKQQLTREEIDKHLDNLIGILGYKVIVDNINRQFDVDTAAWFVEELEKDYEL